MIVDLLLQISNLVSYILSWLFSSDSAGILTITTGLIAWLVYYHQIKLREKEAAIMLINEIRHAEKIFEQITSTGFDVQNEIVSILPTCSWNKNYKIFTHYISRDDFELLNNFFNVSHAVQKELDQWRRYYVIAREEKAREIQRILLKYESEIESDEEYNNKKEKLINRANAEDFLFNFSKPQTYFSKYLTSLPKISGSTVMQSLRAISKEE